MFANHLSNKVDLEGNNFADLFQIAVVLPKGETKYISTSKFSELYKSEDFSKSSSDFFGVDDKHKICIRIGDTIIPDIQQIPLDDILCLCSSFRRSPSSPPLTTCEAWLEYMGQDQRVEFSLPICDLNGEFFVDYHFSLPYVTHHSQLTRPISITFGIPVDSVFVADLFCGLSDFSLFFQSLSRNQVFIVADVSASHRTMVSKRCEFLNDLYVSELVYGNVLRVTKDYVLPFLDEYSILSSDMLLALEIILSTMEVMSASLVSKFEATRKSFFSKLSAAFSDFSQETEVYGQYMRMYARIADNLADFSSDPIRRTLLLSYETQPVFESKSCSMLLAEVYQRIVKYCGIIDEVLRATPKGHADYAPLVEVEKKLVEFLNSMKENA